MSQQRLTRRDALEATAALLFGAGLAGCGRREPEVPAAPPPAAPPVAPPRAASESKAGGIRQLPPRDPAETGWEVIAWGAQGPGPRSRHGLVYDRQAKATVLFGGIVWQGRGKLPADTWELQDRQWTEVKGAGAPPPRHRGAMVYDDHRGQIVLYGGQGSRNEFLADTWTYAARRWQKCGTAPEAAGPGPLVGHSMAFDESAGLTVLFGGVKRDGTSAGDTWLFDGATWKPVTGAAPPARRYAALAYDPGLKGCLLHGGSDDESGQRGFGDAWLFRDGAWSKLGTGFETPPRDDHALAYHRKAKRLVMLEGLARQRGILVRDEQGWRPVTARPLHPRHQCSPLAWDEGLGALVLHGGEAHHAGPQFDETLALVVPGAL